MAANANHEIFSKIETKCFGFARNAEAWGFAGVGIWELGEKRALSQPAPHPCAALGDI
jgi:hypothetical protein